MGLRIPQNQAVTSKYTAGKEYMFVQTYREYIGYYYELNGKIFAGKEFNLKAPELIKINSNNVNKLLTNPSTYTYGKISGVKIPSQRVVAQPKSDTATLTDKGGELFLNFYCQQINQYSIKQIDENTYIKLQSDPLYKTTYIGNYNNKYQTLEEADKQLPGVKLFVEG